ncbi:hypothetical protein SDC9_43495 [bioreactor metagenome]|jgi:hypothetical protein|uniref:Uncharacterized protein n=1 Tax=bioreactor metagenome TaxID=1076179 RepID=A0A644W1B6_9ZZZZ|nr:hypothetical protein [Acidaminococcaceae bacterium]
MTTFNKALILGAILTAMAASTAFADGGIGKNTVPLQGNGNGTVCEYQNNGDNSCYGPQPDNSKNGQGRGFCGGGRR